ncbi:hypothetical protein NW768_004820 [Fusarium equiseti]|uniref:Uncharacterized protein n=1 Tax=Fusarium equiseti TaxID=61235 RepID=A0ABQ8RHC5_FUSEQ|nr:hypothetical protein NW768_004820 [Fusarium equiseti]
MSERETDEPPSHELATQQTFEETITVAIRQLLTSHELLQTELLAVRENVAAMGKRLKCLREEIASTYAKIAAWADESISLMEELEYWDEKMAYLTEGQENIKYQSVTIKLLEGLIASTKEKVVAHLEMMASLMEKQASLRKAHGEGVSEINREQAKLEALDLVSKQIFRVKEKITEALKSGGTQESSKTGHD